MWHGTVHGPDTLDFSRTSKLDHVRTHVCMCAHVRVRFGDVAVLLRNSKDQKVRKLESEKRWKKLDKAHAALECTLISRGYAGKHLGYLSELSFLTDKVARFLFELHADDYKSLGLPVIPPFASSGTIHKKLKPHHVIARMYKKNI